MQSHQCEFTPAQALSLVLPSLAPAALFALLLHLGAWSGAFPAPRPMLDMDRTVLLHQAHAARAASTRPAPVVLVGDSSCLMNVVALRLGERLGSPALNLASLSYLDLPSHAALVRQYDQSHPGHLRTVVLLMHPEALRLADPPEVYRRFLQDCLAGTDPGLGRHWADRVEAALGLPIFRGRFLAPLVPIPLPADYAVRYGFTHDLWRHLDAQAGSLAEPGRFDRSKVHGNAEYRLAKRIEFESRQFRAQLPTSLRLAVGITPAPVSFVQPDHAARCQRMLAQWGSWLRAEALLTNLPVALPDAQFASLTHLTPEGARGYTDALARELLSASALRR